jgi:hypothetical protein
LAYKTHLLDLFWREHSGDEVRVVEEAISFLFALNSGSVGGVVLLLHGDISMILLVDEGGRLHEPRSIEVSHIESFLEVAIGLPVSLIGVPTLVVPKSEPVLLDLLLLPPVFVMEGAVLSLD